MYKRQLWYGTPEAIKDMVTQSGAERINELTAQGRAVILLAPHFIGLDAAATRLTMEVPSAATMYTPQSDPHIDAVVAAGRARFNEVFLVSRKDGVRDLIRHLRAPRPVYYLPDMDFGRQGAVFAPFFGIQAATLLATAQLAKKWDAAVLPILDFWNPETGRYHAEVLPPLENFPGEMCIRDRRSPGRSTSSFMARHIEQPGWRHSKPASTSVAAMPSASAWARTAPEPGTTMARTPSATLRPRTMSATTRRSSMRPLVHEPMKTRSIGTPAIGAPGCRPM